MKVRVKGVDVNDLIVKKFNQNEVIHKANILHPQANIQRKEIKINNEVKSSPFLMFHPLIWML